ncbi:hypothetical protein Dda_7290 [Drechslerella dactyloides]|uniref:Fungal N-terminal domain-containing protein n=1 Tax=Drechslerella dactyloides TaxID=74499 RepID=A0AAD6ITS1_DREDA|nr:hypothetical protein Dda_7290 [Drechslerella dactyloides]
MSDPFSITAGVLGILAAITDLSLKFHQFQETFTEATSEVGRINDSLSEFAIILKHLEDVCASGDIPNPLRTSLSVLLDRINLTVMGMDVYVRTALKRKKLWRGAHWVFSGKEQCRQLQQHLDSYKSTLNITLTLADIISGRQLIEEKADHILSAINHTRRHITTASGSDGFILERYLSELESVYEVSTMTGGLWDVETIGREATTPRPEHHLESVPTILISIIMILLRPSISLLSLSLLPLGLAEILSYDVTPGRILGNNPGQLSASQSKRDVLQFPPSRKEAKSLPRWLPRAMNNNLQARQMSAMGDRSNGLICVANGPSCGPGAFCYDGLGCCLPGQTGCGSNSCCTADQKCCSAQGGGCCPSGYNCVNINGKPGCCLEGTNCGGVGEVVSIVEGVANPNDGGMCQNSGFGICPSRTFCCPAGRKCLRDAEGKPACERVCEDASFFVCPSNDFCCPNGSTCFVDDTGKSRCRVTIVTTITSASDSPASTSSSSQASTSTPSPSPSSTESTSSSSSTTSTTDAPSSTTTSDTSTTSSSLMTTTDSSTSTSISSTTTTTSSSTSRSAAPPNRGNNGITGPLPPPNGGLDNIFTNSATVHNLNESKPVLYSDPPAVPAAGRLQAFCIAGRLHLRNSSGQPLDIIHATRQPASKALVLVRVRAQTLSSCAIAADWLLREPNSVEPSQLPLPAAPSRSLAPSSPSSPPSSLLPFLPSKHDQKYFQRAYPATTREQTIDRQTDAIDGKLATPDILRIQTDSLFSWGWHSYHLGIPSSTAVSLLLPCRFSVGPLFRVAPLRLNPIAFASIQSFNPTTLPYLTLPIDQQSIHRPIHTSTTTIIIMASQDSTTPAAAADQHEQQEEAEESQLAPPSPPLSDSETNANAANASTTNPATSAGNHPRRPHHLTTTTTSNPSFAASTSSSFRRAAESANHTNGHGNSLISPAATTASASSVRSRSGGRAGGPGSVTSSSSERRRKGTTLPADVGPYANSTFASRQRSINGDGDARKAGDGRPVWR